MKATCEISLYPFHKNYKHIIIDFVQRLKTYKKIVVETNGLSTMVFGDYELIMDILKKELRSDLEVFAYMLNHGFISEHVKPVIQNLKEEKKITFKNPSFKTSTVWDKNRPPSQIILI